MRPRLKFLIGIVAMTLATWTAAAQNGGQIDSLSVYNLDEVVVTGQYEPQSVEKSVFRVRTIPMERIQARGAVRLQDVLNTELNIRFSQDLALGTSSITMQGLEGQNVKVLIDGVPMVGRQGSDNAININQINVNSIERIEIIEGPMSVVYGADALAGVINIITKKSADGKIDVTARLHEESVGKEYGVTRGIHNEGVGVGYSMKKWTTRFDVARNDFGGWKGDSTARERTWHPKMQYLGNGLVQYNNDRGSVYYRVDYLNENIYNPGNFGQGGAAPGFALDQNYITNRLMHQLQGTQKMSDRLTFTGALAYTQYSRRTRTTTVDESNGDVRLSLGAGQQDKTTFDGATFRGTVVYRINKKVSVQPGLDLNHESGEGGRIKAGVQSIGDYAFFLSGEWNATSRVQIRPGVRFIYNTVYQAPPAVPSVNAKIRLTDRQDFRISYGRGFRAPSLRELYFDFFDASHSIEGNPNLKAETSHSVNGSWNLTVMDVDGAKATTAVGGFFNDVHDKINYGLKPGSTVTTYINIDRYKTKGLTWNNTFRNRRWDVNLGFAYTGRYNDLYGDGDNLPQFVWSPEVTTTTAFKTIRGGWNFSVYYKYTGRTPYYQIQTENGQQVATLVKVEPYPWADASIQKQLTKGLSATVGMRNLFNITNINASGQAAATAHSSGPVRPIGSGRSYFVSLNYMFNH